MTFESIGGRDYDMIMAVVIIGSTLYLLTSVAIDILYTIITRGSELAREITNLATEIGPGSEYADAEGGSVARLAWPGDACSRRK